MGNKRNSLTTEEKTKIKLFHAEGRTYHAIAQEIQRSPHTVKKYLLSSPEVMEQVQEIKQELANMFEGLARKMVNSITDQDIQKINAYQRTVSAGICTDKMRLLREQSTANINSLNAIIISVDKKLREEMKMKKEAIEGDIEHEK